MVLSLCQHALHLGGLLFSGVQALEQKLGLLPAVSFGLELVPVHLLEEVARVVLGGLLGLEAGENGSDLELHLVHLALDGLPALHGLAVQSLRGLLQRHAQLVRLLREVRLQGRHLPFPAAARALQVLPVLEAGHEDARVLRDRVLGDQERVLRQQRADLLRLRLPLHLLNPVESITHNCNQNVQ